MDHAKTAKIWLITYAIYYISLCDNWMIPILRRIHQTPNSFLNLDVRILPKIYHTIPLVLIIIYLIFRKRKGSKQILHIFRKGLWILATTMLIFGIAEQLVGCRMVRGVPGTYETMTVIALFMLNISYVLEDSSLPIPEQILVICLSWFTIQGSFEIVFQFFLTHYRHVITTQTRVIITLYVYYILAKKYTHKTPRKMWMLMGGIVLCWIIWISTGFKHHNYEPYAQTIAEEVYIMIGWKINKVLSGLTHYVYMKGFKKSLNMKAKNK